MKKSRFTEEQIVLALKQAADIVLTVSMDELSTIEARHLSQSIRNVTAEEKSRWNLWIVSKQAS